MKEANREVLDQGSLPELLAGRARRSSDRRLAADVLRTAISPTWDDVGKLAAIAAIRTVLNFFLEKDIEKYAIDEPVAAR